MGWTLEPGEQILALEEHLIGVQRQARFLAPAEQHQEWVEPLLEAVLVEPQVHVVPIQRHQEQEELLLAGVHPLSDQTPTGACEHPEARTLAARRP